MVATEKTFWDKRYGRNFLKITALLTMLIDHIGCVFLMERGDIIYKAFRAVGRISFPIFCSWRDLYTPAAGKNI